MLAEMGVRVWAAPEPAVAPRRPENAPEPALAQAALAPTPSPAPVAAVLQPPAAQAWRAAPRAVASGAQPVPVQAAWRLDAPRPLYPAAQGVPEAAAPLWLVALDSPTPDDPGGGEAGELLHKMLQAMHLQGTSAVWVSTVRRGVAGAEGEVACDEALGKLRPAIVLALGQSAARCVLGGQEPLAVLRTQEQHLPDGTPVVVSYAPAYLLRSPKAKREAWADLRRAMACVQGQAPMP